MDINILKDKIIGFLKKYRYVILVFVVGIVLMSIPDTTKRSENKEETNSTVVQIESSISDQLAAVLSSIDGAGKVQVMLTVAAGEETIYQTDQDISVSGDSNATRSNTVTVTDAERNQTGLIRQVNPASYLGAIVVCQGADSPSVRLAIVDAVSKATGLGSDRISVLKMK